MLRENENIRIAKIICSVFSVTFSPCNCCYNSGELQQKAWWWLKCMTTCNLVVYVPMLCAAKCKALFCVSDVYFLGLQQLLQSITCSDRLNRDSLKLWEAEEEWNEIWTGLESSWKIAMSKGEEISGNGLSFTCEKIGRQFLSKALFLKLN